jgi:2-dehydro-3-deoxyphosphooctonate aldolase (KDO 8-P synthase)
MPPIRCSSQAGRGARAAASANSSSRWPRRPLATGIAGLFIETHEDPDNAPSDGPNMIPLDQMEGLLTRLMAIDEAAKALAADAGFALAALRLLT